MGTLTVNLSGLELSNPVIAASGTYGYGMEYLDFYDVNCTGSFSIKGTTLHPRTGNRQPRIAEYDGGLLNAVGLENPGVEHVVQEIFPRLQKVYRGKVLANVSGFSMEEYCACAQRLDEQDIVGIIELNISCPNVHGGGMAFGMDAACAAELTAAVRRCVKKPLYVKCTPQCPDLVDLCRRVEDAGADGLVLVNTFLGMRLDRHTGKPLLANVTGGVSGSGIFPQALYRVYQVYPHVHIPISGCGGVSCGSDVIEMLSAGASAVEIGTQNLLDPMCVPKVLRELEDYCREEHIQHITDLIGRAHQ